MSQRYEDYIAGRPEPLDWAEALLLRLSWLWWRAVRRVVRGSGEATR